MKYPHSKHDTKGSKTRPTITGLVMHKERGHDSLEGSIMGIKNRANRGEKWARWEVEGEVGN